jgi:hypothetical protein
MTKGDIVRHKLSGEIYRALKVADGLVICQCPPHSQKMGWYWTPWHRYFCQLENLELYPEGKMIFDWIDSFAETWNEEEHGKNYIGTYRSLISEVYIKPGTQLSLI